MIDLRQTAQYAEYLSSIGWIVERNSGVNYFIKRLPLIGSFIKVQRPEILGKDEFKFIKRLSKKYKAFQISVEPSLTTGSASELHKSVEKQGYRISKSPSLPSKTIHIDLTKSEKQLLTDMHYKTRYNIKKTQNSLRIRNPQGLETKIKIQKSEDINAFANFWQKCASVRGMFLPQKKEIVALYKAFGKNAKLIFVLHSNKLASGILLISTDKISYYMYAASSNFGKKIFAPTLCVWEAIKIAKIRGSKIFDFEGIYDERFPLNTWKGFTRFKKSFGGCEVEYPGVYIKRSFPF